MVQIRDQETTRDETAAKYRSWDGLDDAPDENDSAYVDLVQRDPVVCDTCFTRRYDVFAKEWYRGSFGWMDYVTWDSLPGVSDPVPCDGDAPTGGMRLACSDCGTRGGVKHRPIPKARIHEYTANLSNTLSDKQIDHDPEVLHREVERRNTSDAQCRQDTDVFEPAVERAIHHARPL